MTRQYTQAQVARIFADAEASAARREVSADDWAEYVLGFVSQSLGVTLNRYHSAVAR